MWYLIFLGQYFFQKMEGLFPFKLAYCSNITGVIFNYHISTNILFFDTLLPSLGIESKGYCTTSGKSYS